jgi:mRNA interferase MazF
MGEPSGSEPAYRHPHVVVQNNIFNRSRIATVVVCALTSNLRRADAPGNVLLEKGEANLPKQSVVNISQIFTADKRDLTEKIGTLSRHRIRQILDGIRLLTEPRDIE